MTDLEIIKELSDYLSITLIENNTTSGYSLDKSKKVIRLSFNCFLKDLNYIINSLSNLNYLNELELSGNRDSDIFTIGDISDKEFSIWKNKITDISSIHNLHNLIKLELTSFHIADILPLKELKNLSTLNLKNNHIIDISSIHNLLNITMLDLSENQIEDISSIKGLINLKKLVLSVNRISDISPLENLLLLEDLDLFDNQIEDLSYLRNLSNLRTLHLGNNRITDISAIKELTCLSFLDLRYNLIEELPEWITDFSMNVIFGVRRREGCINLYKNKLKKPPVEIVQLGKKAIKDYYEQIKKEQGKTEYLYESKLLIIGESRAGKTSFAVKLKDADAELPYEEDYTLGIDVGKWDFTFIDPKHPEIGEQKFYVNLWDFGGQKIYRGTHQIFFSDKTLYVLVSDTREVKTTISYWLNSVEQFAGNDSSLIVVINKRLDYTADFDVIDYIERFSKLIKAVEEVNLKDDRTGILRLQEIVRNRLKELPGIGDQLPPSWVKIRKRLLKEIDNFISFDKFRSVCKEYDISDISSIRTLSGYFNRIGVFTHFIDDPVLQDRIYLDSNWLVKNIYKVLDDKKVKARQGRIMESDIMDIWIDDTLLMEKHKLTQLMHNFGLMYHVRNTNNYVVPAHLPEEMPYEKWKYEDDDEILIIIYEFDKYMPDSLISRIIVALHKHIYDQDLVWRRGVNIEYDGSFAEIIKTYEAPNRFKIRLWGTGKEELLEIIRVKINEELEPYKKLNYKELIPCNCPVCKKLKEPNFYEFSDLKERRKVGKTTVVCKKNNFKDVSVNELLQIFTKVKEKNNMPFTDKIIIKIFLASSDELKDERDQIKQFISDENDKYFKQNTHLKLVRWEDEEKGFQKYGYQEYLDAKISKCEIFISMFFSKVGKFSREEFDIANIGFKNGENPVKLYVYFKKDGNEIENDNSEIVEIKELEEYIINAGQTFSSFSSIPDLLFQLKFQLDLIIPKIIGCKYLFKSVQYFN